MYLGVSHASHPKESRVPMLSNFGGSPVFMPTPFKAERLNSAWGGACFQEVSHAFVFAHKCVARFVGDSAVSCSMILLTDKTHRRVNNLLRCRRKLEDSTGSRETNLMSAKTQYRTALQPKCSLNLSTRHLVNESVITVSHGSATLL